MFSLFTPKVALVPSAFFDASSAREILGRTVVLKDEDEVEYISLPEYSAELVYSLSVGDTKLHAVSREEGSAEAGRVLPEMYFILKDLGKVGDYNKIVASYSGTHLHLAVAQGGNLLLANVFEAADFTTAEYFIFLVLKKLQLNPEVSTVYFRTPLAEEEEMSLYRYFKSVERL